MNDGMEQPNKKHKYALIKAVVFLPCVKSYEVKAIIRPQ